MSGAQTDPRLSREALVERLVEQDHEIAALRLQIETLQAEIAPLKRVGRRQAAPFATGKHKAQPQRPGRKPGQGEFRFRALPPPEEITEPIVEVPVTQSACPACGGQLVEDGEEWAYRTEVPPAPQPQVTPTASSGVGVWRVGNGSAGSIWTWRRINMGRVPIGWAPACSRLPIPYLMG